MAAMKPEQALAAVYPEIAATWHPDKNGVHTPENTSAKNHLRAYWRCAAGHEWVETVVARTSMQKWKRGDRAACRICSGHMVETTFTCGHTVLVEAKRSRPDRLCPPCRRAEWERIERELPARREAARAAYATSRDEAQTLLADLAVPTSLPAPLVKEWQTQALTLIRRALVAERDFGHSGAVDTAKQHAAHLLAGLPPTEDQLRAAIEARTPIRIFDKAYWPQGWLHALGYRVEQAPQEDATIDALRTWLQRGLVAVIAEASVDGYDTRTLTTIITELILDWAEAQPYSLRPDQWTGYRELTVPIAPAGTDRYGRVDLVITRPHQADLVVEIDATNNPRSAEKLRFAGAAGAVPVWIRWRAGNLRKLPGTALIDLRDLTSPPTEGTGG